jgi:hypothetical protein
MKLTILLILTFLAGCPVGYELNPGDIPGWGQVGTNPSIETSIIGCSQRCDNQSKCCSFEYSQTEQYCSLNSDCKPADPVYKDYAFCSKGNSWSTYVTKSMPLFQHSRLSVLRMVQ